MNVPGPGGMAGGLQQPWSSGWSWDWPQACPAGHAPQGCLLVLEHLFPLQLAHRRPPGPCPHHPGSGEQGGLCHPEARGAEPVGGVWGEGQPRSALAVCLKLRLLFLPPHGLPSLLVPPRGPAGCCRDAPLPRKAAPRQCLSLLSPWLLRLTIQGKAPRASRQGAGGSSLPPRPAHSA